jgi:RNA polymerase sigma-70 factor (ECF subfamily)
VSGDSAEAGPDKAQVTRWLRQWREGDDRAIEDVTAEMYAELRRLAAHYLRGESHANTLQPTALVHEAYLHLASIRDVDWKARGQFVAVIAQMMRRVLIDHARRRHAAKRDADGALTISAGRGSDPPWDLLDVDRALEHMAARFPRHAKGVELRFFGGLSSPEVARTLDISLATVERDWRFAKAWLHAAITGASE